MFAKALVVKGKILRLILMIAWEVVVFMGGSCLMMMLYES